MAVGLSRFFFFNQIRFFGIIRVLIAHGICSSGLFFFVKKFYENSGSRNILLNQGVLFIRSKRIFL
jgi:NADH:ubiquinone oxidoreductase subunit 4 (subunit M)